MNATPIWYLLQSDPPSAAENMAWDEALLETAAWIGRPVLRFYGWVEPAATFGYFQHFAEVQRMTQLRPLIRRPTGGGLVPHEADWTYSVVVPPSDPWHQMKAVASYRRMHEWLHAAFARLQVETSLSPGRNPEAPGQCFVGAEQDDLLWQRRKIAGAAQRRNRDGLLIQGSVHPPHGIVRADFERAWCEAATARWAMKWREFPGTAELRARAGELTESKYSRTSHNQRR
jgi:lipoate-protein ligase A